MVGPSGPSADDPLLELYRDEGRGGGGEPTASWTGSRASVSNSPCRQPLQDRHIEDGKLDRHRPDDRAQQERVGPRAEREEAFALGPDRQSVAELQQRQGGEDHALPWPTGRPRPTNRARQTAAMVSPTHRACCHSPRAPPSSVAIPVATTTRAPRPPVTAVPRHAIFRRSASSESSISGSGSTRLVTGPDSPVRAASLIRSAHDSVRRRSAASRSPGPSNTRSPGTTLGAAAPAVSGRSGRDGRPSG